MTTQFILTFQDGQEFIDLGEFSPLKNKKEMISFVMGWAFGRWPSKTLVKVSMCVYFENNPFLLPTWFNECNGKFWQDDLVLS